MRRTLLTVSLALAAACTPFVADAEGAPADDSLYQAFGQKAGIEALVEDFFVRLKADPRIGGFFKNAERARLVEKLTLQFCEETGGPCVYDGAPMDARHGGMDIDKAQFNALVEVLQQAMDARGIPFRAQNGLLARLAPMHRDIITRE